MSRNREDGGHSIERDNNTPIYVHHEDGGHLSEYCYHVLYVKVKSEGERG